MRRSARQLEKYADLGNKAQKSSNAKKKRWDNKHSNFATLDNGTMVEAYKFLNYCQLAKNSLVSKRFRTLIQTHRHKLALLYVAHINMDSSQIVPVAIKVFGNELSPDAYNEWVIRNSYSKQIPIDSQVASKEDTESITNGYWLDAHAFYKDSRHRGGEDKTTVFLASVKLNHDNWPVFHHFVRLITDSFIYINHTTLTYQHDVLNVLAGAMNSDHDRLQCEQLYFNMNGNSQLSIIWAKNHARCNKFYIRGAADSYLDETLLDFFLTGAHCTPAIEVRSHEISKVVTDFVQKFMDLKNSGEIQLVEAIQGKIPAIKSFKRKYAKFIVKEERNEDYRSTELVFEFTNNDIRKKLQLTAKTYKPQTPLVLIKINNL